MLLRFKVSAIFIALMMKGMIGFGQYFSIDKYPIYHGNDLGLHYSPSASTFRIWSPIAEHVKILLYKTSLGNDLIKSIEMDQGNEGTWVKTISEDLRGVYYVFSIFSHGKWLNEVPDPYAKAVGTNGKRAVVVDLKDTNPVGWEKDQSPAFSHRVGMKAGLGGLPTDAVIYELHVRDASIHPSSGIKAKGKFTGLSERGTKNAQGESTGLDHLKELGVTHVHLLPSYDFYSIDERKLDSSQYNWGYDPLNYNTPEGSYSTNPGDGITRIKEFKTMIAKMHESGLRVVMDVVYNHTMLTENSYFNQLVPGYYYRQKEDGSFSNASACGNEIASERPMMRKFMIESLTHWVKEYHVDGFRFDLMGIHDIETMNQISKALHIIKPDIILYGEGWTAGGSPLPDSVRALKKNAYELDRIAVFSDDIRDGIKGSVFDHADKGFATGKIGMEESIKFGITASCKHPQIDYSKVNYSKGPYALSPGQVISYCECHDNHVLWDKLAISNKEDSEDIRKEMHKLALSIVLTSQGISFLHAGTEFLRSKKGVENSFNAGDSINAIDWNLKSKNADVYEYVKALISMRKKHPAFRMTKAHDIASLIRFDEKGESGVVSYVIDASKLGDEWKTIQVVLNGTSKTIEQQLSGNSWNVFSNNNRIIKTTLSVSNHISIHPFSAAILYKK